MDAWKLIAFNFKFMDIHLNIKGKMEAFAQPKPQSSQRYLDFEKKKRQQQRRKIEWSMKITALAHMLHCQIHVHL